MRIIAIDTETGGLNPDIHSLLSVGMVVGDLVDGKLTIVDTFYALVDCDGEVTPESLKINKLDMRKISREGLRPKELAEEIEAFVTKHGGQAEPLYFNAPFDIAFLKTCIGAENYERCFHYRFRDAQAVQRALADSGLVPYKAAGLKRSAEHFGVEPGGHHALGDAQATIEVYAKQVQLLSSLQESAEDADIYRTLLHSSAIKLRKVEIALNWAVTGIVLAGLVRLVLWCL